MPNFPNCRDDRLFSPLGSDKGGNGGKRKRRMQKPESGSRDCGANRGAGGQQSEDSGRGRRRKGSLTSNPKPSLVRLDDRQSLDLGKMPAVERGYVTASFHGGWRQEPRVENTTLR